MINSKASKSKIKAFQDRFQSCIQNEGSVRTKGQKKSVASPEGCHTAKKRKRPVGSEHAKQPPGKKRKIPNDLSSPNSKDSHHQASSGGDKENNNTSNGQSCEKQRENDSPQPNQIQKRLSSSGSNIHHSPSKSEIDLLIEEYKQNPHKSKAESKKKRNPAAAISTTRAKDAVLERFRKNTKQKRIQKQQKAKRRGTILKPLKEAKKEALQNSTSQLEVVRKFQASMMGKYKCSKKVTSVRKRPVASRSKSKRDTLKIGETSRTLEQTTTRDKDPPGKQTDTALPFETIIIDAPPKELLPSPQHPICEAHCATSETEEVSESEHKEASRVETEKVEQTTQTTDVHTNTSQKDSPAATSSSPSQSKVLPKSTEKESKSTPKFKQLSQTNYLIQKYKVLHKASSKSAPVSERVDKCRSIMIQLVELGYSLVELNEERTGIKEMVGRYEREADQKLDSFAAQLSATSPVHGYASSDYEMTNVGQHKVHHSGNKSSTDQMIERVDIGRFDHRITPLYARGHSASGELDAGSWRNFAFTEGDHHHQTGDLFGDPEFHSSNVTMTRAPACVECNENGTIRTESELLWQV